MQELQITLPIGTVIRGRYIIEGLLGKGGFGAVYLVRDQRVKGNLFALKEVIDPDKQERARFAFEGEVLKRLDSPHLPRVYRVFEDDKNNREYMLMDYIEGPNLETLRQRQPEKGFPLSQVMSIMAPIKDAITDLHSQNPPIIHRDIKPANIIVPAHDEAVLVDFGIAKEYDPDSTTTAVRRCSPGYGAPEQYSRGTNTRTDIYGLGATLYALLTGIVPEDAFYRMTQLGSNGIDPLEPVHQIVPSIPLPLSQAISRAMSISSNDRFATVSEFWQALNAAYPKPVASQGPVTPPPLPFVTPIVTNKPIQDLNTVSLVKSPLEPNTATIKKRRILPIVLLIFALIIGLASASGLIWSYVGNHPSASVPAPISTHQPKAGTTPTARATGVPTATSVPATPTAVPTATSIPPTPTSVPATYPSVAGTHSGTIHNTNINSDGGLSLSLQQNQGNIGGSVTISGQLVGSGPITSGNVQTNRYIQFTVQGYKGNAPLFFTGTVHADGSMQGNYCSLDKVTSQCSANAGGQGYWSVGPGPGGSS